MKHPPVDPPLNLFLHLPTSFDVGIAIDMARSRPTAGSDGSCVADKPKVKLLHSMSSMVTVIVGPSEQVFCIYESLLRSHSAFFEAALSGDWREGKDKVVRLNDVHRYFFGCFLEWLCNGCLVLSSEIDDEADVSLTRTKGLLCFLSNGLSRSRNSSKMHSTQLLSDIRSLTYHHPTAAYGTYTRTTQDGSI